MSRCALRHKYNSHCEVTQTLCWPLGVLHRRGKIKRSLTAFKYLLEEIRWLHVCAADIIAPTSKLNQPTSSVSRVIRHMSDFLCKLSQNTLTLLLSHTLTHTAPLLPTSHGWSICCRQNASWCTQKHTNTRCSWTLITLEHAEIIHRAEVTDDLH